MYDHLGTRYFNDFISYTGLFDIKLGGRKFIWMNSDCSKMCKLDRFLVNTRIINQWPMVNTMVLTRVFLDHCPILLDSGSPDFGAVLSSSSTRGSQRQILIV